MIDVKKAFQDATDHLVDDIAALGDDVVNMVQHMRQSMTLPTVRMAMVPSFHQMNFYPSRGFCEIASLLWIYHMGDAWDLMQIRGTDWSHGPHFYTRHRISGQIIDITVDQYSIRNLTVPYHLGQRVEIDRRRKKLLDMYLECLHLQNK